MAFVINDRVLETSTSTGTGTFTLAGAASGFQTFANGIGASNTTYYTIVNTAASEWEVGLATLDATGLILTRTTVYRSSNSNNAVTFTAGTKNVFVTYPSTKSVNYDASGNIAISNVTLTGATITNTGNMTFSGTGLRFTGDFTNATVTNRLAFQTSTSNSTTGIYALPNGASTAASWQATNAADPTNASKILIATNGTTDVQLVSGINGTGTGSGVGGVLSVTITNGGTGYASGGTNTYTNVALTGGAGANVIASTIVVTAGVVTAVTFPATGSGYGYVVGNTLTTANTNLGGSGSGLSLTVASIAGYLPLTFYNNGAEKARLAVSGGFSVGTATDPGAGVISAANGFKFGTNATAQTLPFSPTSIMVNFGTTRPVQSFNYTFADANVTTSSKVSLTSIATPSNALLALGTVTGGSSYTNGTYYNVDLTGTQTVTISIASPGIVTLSNALPNGTPITLTTTGALPTGLTAGVTYYVVNSSALTCNLAATVGGAGINTSGSPSGVQSLVSTTGTGATATQVVVSGNVVTSVSLPTSTGAVANGTISTAGSGYLPASGTTTYLNVPLTGGAGVDAVATSVTVTNGAVTAVVLPTTGAGAGYAVGNTLSASNTFLGGSGSSFVYTVSAVSSFGTGYSYGDVLFAAAANIGGSGSGFSTPVALVSTGADELEMDGIKAAAYCGTNGLVTVYFDASPGYVAGGRNFAYTLG